MNSHTYIDRHTVDSTGASTGLCPGQIGGADQTGVLAQLGHPDGGGEPVAAAGELGLECLPGRADRQLAGLRHPRR
jgi:hypothetical protein